MTGEKAAGDKGSGTGAKGTPVPVEVSAAPAFRTSLMLFLAGPLIWTAHFGLVYLVAEAGCTGDGPGLNLFDPPVPTVVTLVATAAAVVASLTAARRSYRRWREMQEEQDDDQHSFDPTGAGSLAFIGYLLALLASVVVLFVGLPALVIPACLG